MGQTPYVSVVIPAYNEETRIGKSLESMAEFFSKEGISYEIIVVNDGSRDRTSDVALAHFREAGHGQLVENEGNRGKGFSVRRGMLAARGEYRFFSDADLSTPIHEVRKFLPLLEKQYDIVIGSRAVPGANIRVRQALYRELMGKTFNLLVRMTIISQLHDTQCGFKGFRQAAVPDIFERQQLDGFSFDVEILYIAKRLGYSIREEPIEWHNSFESKVGALSGARAFKDLLKIRRLHRSLKARPNSVASCATEPKVKSQGAIR